MGSRICFFTVCFSSLCFTVFMFRIANRFSQIMVCQSYCFFFFCFMGSSACGFCICFCSAF
ncbi:hypothetical protein FN846DRAFT_960196 [Sphaerosporella brunnea]|uniref:Uncharacterized protein n=1 Tax=Sphaerosporella brunnea TaxID=1250544 RepID=A0A5J5EQF6_9PEZI|nr:hypothetical protein FN846DRAFT_960196 [Sphaerosporella brunnea]